MKVIAISGVPGTGKTATAKILAKRMKANFVSINEVIKKDNVEHEWDAKRKSKIVDIPVLQKAVTKNLGKGTNIVEGHMSHLLKWDKLVILRCDPFVLRKRLEKKKWGKAKVSENVAAETLGVVSVESLAKGRTKVYEVDTTSLSAQQTAEFIEKILKDPRLASRFRPGKVDWLEKYKYRIAKIAQEQIGVR